MSQSTDIFGPLQSAAKSSAIWQREHQKKQFQLFGGSTPLASSSNEHWLETEHRARGLSEYEPEMILERWDG